MIKILELPLSCLSSLLHSTGRTLAVVSTSRSHQHLRQTRRKSKRRLITDAVLTSDVAHEDLTNVGLRQTTLCIRVSVYGRVSVHVRVSIRVPVQVRIHVRVSVQAKCCHSKAIAICGEVYAKPKSFHGIVSQKDLDRVNQ